MKITRIAFCFSIVLFSHCGNDEKNNSATKNNLAGRWELKYAELNGNAAPSLERIYFQFDGANLTTNFNEATTDETTPFELKDGKIIKKSAPPIEFEVENQTDSTLEITTEMRGYDFKLVLLKK